MEMYWLYRHLANEFAPTGTASALTLFIDPLPLLLIIMRDGSDNTIATWVQAERRWRAVGRAAWMPREPPPPWMAAGPRSVAGAEGTRRSRAKPGARTLGYLVSFQVTRRRRNASAVRQNPSSTPQTTDIHTKPNPKKTGNRSCPKCLACSFYRRLNPCRACASPSR